MHKMRLFLSILASVLVLHLVHSIIISINPILVKTRSTASSKKDVTTIAAKAENGNGATLQYQGINHEFPSRTDEGIRTVASSVKLPTTTSNDTAGKFHHTKRVHENVTEISNSKTEGTLARSDGLLSEYHSKYNGSVVTDFTCKTIPHMALNASHSFSQHDGNQVSTTISEELPSFVSKSGPKLSKFSSHFNGNSTTDSHSPVTSGAVLIVSHVLSQNTQNTSRVTTSDASMSSLFFSKSTINTFNESFTQGEGKLILNTTCKTIPNRVPFQFSDQQNEDVPSSANPSKENARNADEEDQTSELTFSDLITSSQRIEVKISNSSAGTGTVTVKTDTLDDSKSVTPEGESNISESSVANNGNTTEFIRENEVIFMHDDKSTSKASTFKAPFIFPAENGSNGYQCSDDIISATAKALASIIPSIATFGQTTGIPESFNSEGTNSTTIKSERCSMKEFSSIDAVNTTSTLVTQSESVLNNELPCKVAHSSCNTQNIGDRNQEENNRPAKTTPSQRSNQSTSKFTQNFNQSTSHLVPHNWQHLKTQPETFSLANSTRFSLDKNSLPRKSTTIQSEVQIQSPRCEKVTFIAVNNFDFITQSQKTVTTAESNTSYIDPSNSTNLGKNTYNPRRRFESIAENDYVAKIFGIGCEFGNLQEADEPATSIFKMQNDEPSTGTDTNVHDNETFAKSNDTPVVSPNDLHCDYNVTIHLVSTRSPSLNLSSEEEAFTTSKNQHHSPTADNQTSNSCKTIFTRRTTKNSYSCRTVYIRRTTTPAAISEADQKSKKLTTSNKSPEVAKRMTKVKPLAGNVSSNAGFFMVNRKHGARLFFWFVKSKNNSSHAPLIVWLQGQPGWSSLYGMFDEHGPYSVQETDAGISFELREFAWTNEFNVLYLDHCIGCGYSTAKRKIAFKPTYETVAANVYHALVEFFRVFSEYKDNDLYLAGEHGCAKYIPVIADLVRTKNAIQKADIRIKGAMIGGPYIDAIAMSSYSHYLYTTGLIDENELEKLHMKEQYVKSLIQATKYKETIEFLNQNLYTKFDEAGYQRLYDLRYERPIDGKYTFERYMQKVVRNKRFIEAIHAEELQFRTKSELLIEDTMKPIDQVLSSVLQHYKVLYYNGQFDMLTPYSLTAEYFTRFRWKEMDSFYYSQLNNWRATDEGYPNGYWKYSNNLTHVLIRDAGHTVGTTKPKTLLQLLKWFVEKKFETTYTPSSPDQRYLNVFI